MNIGIVGQGVVGSAMERLFQDNTEHSVAIYDKFKPACNTAAHVHAINRCDIVFVSVPTPAQPDGMGCDLAAVEECVRWIARPMCIRSTIPPGTCDRLFASTGKAIAFSPEYLGESVAHPWPEDAMCGFLIVGGPDCVLDLVEQAYRPAVQQPTEFLRTTALTAEICKYMENCFLATKVAFVNQFYDIAQAFHVDYAELRKLWVTDPRIGESHTFVTRERGFRGRCLPKDISAMIAAMQVHGGAPLLQSVRSYNDAVCAAADKGQTRALYHTRSEEQ